MVSAFMEINEGLIQQALVSLLCSAFSPRLSLNPASVQTTGSRPLNEQEKKSFVLDFSYRLLARNQNGPLNIAYVKCSVVQCK